MSDQPDAVTSTEEHTTLTRQIFMQPARFEPTVPPIERLQTHALQMLSATSI